MGWFRNVQRVKDYCAPIDLNTITALGLFTGRGPRIFRPYRALIPGRHRPQTSVNLLPNGSREKPIGRDPTNGNESPPRNLELEACPTALMGDGTSERIAATPSYWRRGNGRINGPLLLAACTCMPLIPAGISWEHLFQDIPPPKKVKGTEEKEQRNKIESQERRRNKLNLSLQGNEGLCTNLQRRLTGW